MIPTKFHFAAIAVILSPVLMLAGAAYGQAGSSPSGCNLITPEALEALIKSESLPVYGPNGGCTFFASRFGEQIDPLKTSFIWINPNSAYAKASTSDPTFTPETIAQVERWTHTDCEAPFMVEGKPALWCAQYSDKFTLGFAKYSLYIHDQGTTRSVYFGNWHMPTDAAKASAINIAETAFYHHSSPGEALQFTHQAHNLRKGKWVILESIQGEGYFNLPLQAPNAFATCINDRGASLQELLPQGVASCRQGVKQVSNSQESVTSECKNNSSDPFFDKYSDSYKFYISYPDAEHYTVEGKHVRFETVKVREGIATIDQRQEIGTQSIRILASWKNDQCDQ